MPNYIVEKTGATDQSWTGHVKGAKGCFICSGDNDIGVNMKNKTMRKLDSVLQSLFYQELTTDDKIFSQFSSDDVHFWTQEEVLSVTEQLQM